MRAWRSLSLSVQTIPEPFLARAEEFRPPSIKLIINANEPWAPNSVWSPPAWRPLCPASGESCEHNGSLRCQFERGSFASVSCAIFRPPRPQQRRRPTQRNERRLIDCESPDAASPGRPASRGRLPLAGSQRRGRLRLALIRARAAKTLARLAPTMLLNLHKFPPPPSGGHLESCLALLHSLRWSSLSLFASIGAPIVAAWACVAQASLAALWALRPAQTSWPRSIFDGSTSLSGVPLPD